MKIELIYTFDGTKEQKIMRYPFVPNILKSKRNFIDFCLADLNREDKSDLIKISSCIITALKYPIGKDKNHWFHKCSGKIWIDDLEKYRKVKNIQSTVSKDYLTQFADANS